MTIPCKDEYAEDEIKSYRVFAFVFLFCIIKKNPTAKYVWTQLNKMSHLSLFEILYSWFVSFKDTGQQPIKFWLSIRINISKINLEYLNKNGHVPLIIMRTFLVSLFSIVRYHGDLHVLYFLLGCVYSAFWSGSVSRVDNLWRHTHISLGKSHRRKGKIEFLIV